MSLRSSIFQKELLNTIQGDEIEYNIQDTIEPKQNTYNTIQLSAEQAIQLGLKFYDNESENVSSAISPTTDQIFHLPQSSQKFEGDVINLNEDLNLHRIVKNPNPNLLSFVIKPVASNSSIVNKNVQIKETSSVPIDDINELLSFNNDEEGTVYLQNNTLNGNESTQQQYKQLINRQVMQSSEIGINNISKNFKQKAPRVMNSGKPYKLIGQPINRQNKINYCNQTITLPNSQKISLQSLLSKKPSETQSVLNSNAGRPVSIVPIKKQHRVKSILNQAIKPISTTSNNSVQGNHSALQTQLQSFNKFTLNNNSSNSVLNQIELLRTNNLTDKSTVIPRPENSIRALPIHNGVQDKIQDPLSYKIEYRLDLVDSNSESNNGQNITYTINLANDQNKEDTMQKQTTKSTAVNDISEVTFNKHALNKPVSSTSKIENSIVPLSKSRVVPVTEPETTAVQEALQRYPVNSNKPLGSTDNPIKLVQKGQTFHSLQSLNENQLQQIAGALKHRPPYQQSGDREPHKVVLYDSATHTRIIYRIVYPDELNLKPQADLDTENENKTVKEKRKKKINSKNISIPIVPAQENKQPLPRTRTGRVIRPPNRIMYDYKRLKPNDDSDKEEWIDSVEEEIPGPSSQNSIKPSDSEHPKVDESQSTMESPKTEPVENKEIPKRTKKINSKYICPTCNKCYLGYGKMSRHLTLYPDHGDLESLGIDPPYSKSKLKKKPYYKSKPTNGVKNEGEVLNISDNSNDGSGCTKTLFECLMQKIERTDESSKWNSLCKELNKFMQDVQGFVATKVTSSENILEENKIVIDDQISRILDMKPGQYIWKDSFSSETPISNETTAAVSASCPSSPVENILENSFSSLEQIKQMTNHSVDNIDIDMLCSSNSDFEKGVLSNPRSVLQRQMDILINQDSCQNLSSLPEAVRGGGALENMNAIRDSMTLNSEDGMVYQNVDDLVHESLKNLTADEIAAVPPLEHSPDDLVNSQTSLQDLSLDLFQFHH